METLKKFMNENKVTGFELINNLIVSVIVGDTLYALEVDTSNVPGGTLVDNVTEFTIVGDELIISNFSINMNDIYIASTDSDIK